jgi:hypothetical protein
VFLIAILHDERVGALLQPVARFRDDLGALVAQEVRHHRHEGEVLLGFIRHDKGTVGEICQRGLCCRFREIGEFCDVLHRDFLREVGECCQSLGFCLGEGFQQIAEDELQRVIAVAGLAAECQRIGDAAAGAAPQLPHHPAQ